MIKLRLKPNNNIVKILWLKLNFAVEIKTDPAWFHCFIFPLAVSLCLPAIPPTSATQGALWLRRCRTCSVAWLCCGGFSWRKSPRSVRSTQPRAADSPQPQSSSKAPRWVPLTGRACHYLYTVADVFIYCRIPSKSLRRSYGSTSWSSCFPSLASMGFRSWPRWGKCGAGGRTREEIKTKSVAGERINAPLSPEHDLIVLPLVPLGFTCSEWIAFSHCGFSEIPGNLEHQHHSAAGQGGG